MSANMSESPDGIHDINITPFVDVVLVLLMIFMITAPLMFSAQIPLSLPSANTAEVNQQTQELGIIILSDGDLLLNGNAVSKEEFIQTITKQQSSGALLRALISADKQTPHGSVVDILDTLRQLGIEQYAINVVPNP